MSTMFTFSPAKRRRTTPEPGSDATEPTEQSPADAASKRRELEAKKKSLAAEALRRDREKSRLQNSASGGVVSNAAAKMERPRKMQDGNLVRRASPQGTKTQPPISPLDAAQRAELEKRKDKKRLKRVLEARLKALKDEVAEMEVHVQREERRIEIINSAEQRLEVDQNKRAEAMIARLLVANDLSFKSLPTLPTPDPKTHSDAPSTRPIEVDDPLPQLRVFSALTFTLNYVSVVSSESSSAMAQNGEVGVIQRHDIAGYGEDRLLFFKVGMEVDTKGLTVEKLECELSDWAKGELGLQLKKFAEEKNVNSTLYSLSSYSTLAKTRATTFARLCRTYPDLLPQFASASPSSKQKGKRRSDASSGHDSDTEIPQSRREITPWLGEQLLRFRARTSEDPEMSFSGPNKASSTISGRSGSLDRSGGEKNASPELVITWNIKCDLTGEAESEIAAHLRLPSYWNEVDQMKSLGKIGEVFDTLMKDRGVFNAVKCIVGLVFQ
ncbi:hypothetical protein RUND412_006285 [Rhizina undulata]